LLLLAAGAFACATLLQPRMAELQARNPTRDDPLAMLFGEGRKILAARAFARADIYMHRGFYPSIFEQAQDSDSAAATASAAVRPTTPQSITPQHDAHNCHEHDCPHCHSAQCEHDHAHHQTLDWIERHGRKHLPSEHTHLDADQSGVENPEREILPWLGLSARLDPDELDSWIVGAYWLQRVGKIDQAEEFLRQGLQHIPGHPNLIFELGRCRLLAGDDARAGELWLRAWQSWQHFFADDADEDDARLSASQILLHLADLARKQGRLAESHQWLETLLPYSPNPATLRRRIQELERELPPESRPEVPTH